MYSLALIPTYALQVNPAVHVVEVLFLKGRVPEKGKSTLRKWLKNIIRSLFVLTSVVIAVLFSNNLDYMLSIVATVSCTPLGFILPAAFHLKNKATTSLDKLFDISIMIFGIVAIVGCLTLTFVY